MAMAMGFTVNPDNTLGSFDKTKVSYPLTESDTGPDRAASDSTLQSAFTDIYAKQAALAAATKAYTGDKSKLEEDPNWRSANEALNTSRGSLAAAVEANTKAHTDWTKWAVTSMNDRKFLSSIAAPRIPQHLPITPSTETFMSECVISVIKMDCPQPSLLLPTDPSEL